jgi:hypothetical protein
MKDRRCQGLCNSALRTHHSQCLPRFRGPSHLDHQIRERSPFEQVSTPCPIPEAGWSGITETAAKLPAFAPPGAA